MTRKSVQDCVAAIDEKIQKKKAEIQDFEAQKQRLLHPVTKRNVMTKVKGRHYTRGDCREVGFRAVTQLGNFHPGIISINKAVTL